LNGNFRNLDGLYRPSQSGEEAVASTTKKLGSSQAAEATREVLTFMSQMLERDASGSASQG
jgi:ABC-type Fe3+ transport system substrate-binding protein